MNPRQYYKDLATNVKIERVRKGLSQLELAEKAGVTIDTVGTIERGTANPALEKVISIALALDVDLNTLVPLK